MSHVLQSIVLLAAVLVVPSAQAGMGLAELPADAVSGPVTVFYPSEGAEGAVARGAFRFDAASEGPPSPGNHRLVVISHGSPSSPWVHVDLARALVGAGFTVALPEHQGDNARSHGDSGPVSWRRRPLEVSRAIDRLAQEPRWSQTLDFDAVGMFGMSAGGHTALTLAGGRWSPSRLLAHCQEHLERDFHTCAGPSWSLDGGLLDGVKKAIVRIVLGTKLADTAWYGHVDPRITAIVAGVPFAADFDPDSLRHPVAALGIVSAGADRWLVPRFHSDAVLAQCGRCVHLLGLPAGGHGALLSPLPPDLSGAVGALVADPPDFRREAEVARLNVAVTEFFLRQLVRTRPGSRG
ncbi:MULTISPECIES: dienelactone hydrolase [Ramlibacter]|uniref:dienelactone hydrolase n=1 Tax=Ramlibacter TaxID=174951 RepID=UPI0015EF1C9E|nr:dienelactone hydrolase [Ramlibacter sp. CGMCC 1.13660]